MSSVPCTAVRVFGLAGSIPTLNSFVTSNIGPWGQDLNGAAVSDRASFLAAVSALRAPAGRATSRWASGWASFQFLQNSTTAAPDGLSLDSTVFALRDAGIDPLLGALQRAVRAGLDVLVLSASSEFFLSADLTSVLSVSCEQCSGWVAGLSTSRRSTAHSPRTGPSAGAAPLWKRSYFCCGVLTRPPLRFFLLTGRVLSPDLSCICLSFRELYRHQYMAARWAYIRGVRKLEFWCALIARPSQGPVTCDFCRC